MSCSGFSPIRPTLAEIEQMSDGTLNQILAHNKHGQSACGWRP